MHVLVILTYGVSFKDWAQSGLLDREILLYEKLLKEKKIRFTFVSFGDSEDTELINDFNVIPFYKYNIPANGKLKNLFNEDKLIINENGKAKLEISHDSGKKNYDKRQSIKEKDLKRETERIKNKIK